MRWLSIPWALIALVATWLIAARVSGNLNRATWIMALVAFLPQYQHLSGTVTMDIMLSAQAQTRDPISVELARLNFLYSEGPPLLVLWER